MHIPYDIRKPLGIRTQLDIRTQIFIRTQLDIRTQLYITTQLNIRTQLGDPDGHIWYKCALMYGTCMPPCMVPV